MTKTDDFRILIIDDNPDIHSDFMKILKSDEPASKLEGLGSVLFGVSKNDENIILPAFKIDTASQGEEGVNKIRKAYEEGVPFALAFVDVRMPPGMDGVETIKRIWEVDTNIQVVICTAYSDYSWEETITELGSTDNLLILKKPFDSTSVRQLACALTKKWKLMRESRQYTKNLEQKIDRTTEELKHLATHDALTGLPNRVLLRDELMEAVKEYEKNSNGFAIMFIDIDRFKLVNDSLSHSAGDQLLSFVAKNIKECLSEADMVARLGGDEFVVIIKNVVSSNHISKIAKRLLTSIARPNVIGDQTLRVTGSIGISQFPSDSQSIDELISKADVAMYQSKKFGGAQYQLYKHTMNQDNLERLKTETELRIALERGEFFLCYQPIYNSDSKELVSAEALIRWRHPTKNVVLPKDFIPIAEEAGLMLELGEWVLREACRQNAEWQKAGMRKIRVAVNVTSRQLQQTGFASVVASVLAETGLDAQYLELELNERVIVNAVNAKSIIEDLRKLGVNISIDDFGTGNSSLSYIRNVPLDRIKIDQSFVANINSNDSDEVIIKAIIAMAQALHLEVVAEGVESVNQLDFLKGENCNQIQGYYFSAPLLSDEFKEVLAGDEAASVERDEESIK